MCAFQYHYVLLGSSYTPQAGRRRKAEFLAVEARKWQGKGKAGMGKVWTWAGLGRQWTEGSDCSSPLSMKLKWHLMSPFRSGREGLKSASCVHFQQSEDQRESDWGSWVVPWGNLTLCFHENNHRASVKEPLSQLKHANKNSYKLLLIFARERTRFQHMLAKTSFGFHILVIWSTPQPSHQS